MPKKQLLTFIDGVPDYKVGDPRPEGYLEFHAWAQVQIDGGLKQRECPVCKLWFFPQEAHSHGAK